MLVGVFDCCCHRHDNSTPARDGSENCITREDSVLLSSGGESLWEEELHLTFAAWGRGGGTMLLRRSTRATARRSTPCRSADLRAPESPPWAEPPPEFAEFSGRGSHVLRSALAWGLVEASDLGFPSVLLTRREEETRWVGCPVTTKGLHHHHSGGAPSRHRGLRPEPASSVHESDWASWPPTAAAAAAAEGLLGTSKGVGAPASLPVVVASRHTLSSTHSCDCLEELHTVLGHRQGQEAAALLGSEAATTKEVQRTDQMDST
jgi:hypothetical protein